MADFEDDNFMDSKGDDSLAGVLEKLLKKKRNRAFDFCFG